jgi:hypothetical protein
MDSATTTTEPGRFCAACGARLSPAARFCHRCGTEVGTGGAASAKHGTAPGTLPWAVAAIALVALISLVAGQVFARRSGPAAAAAPARAPDISAIPPQERAERLFHRVMTYSSAGMSDSALFFAPMALGAFEALSPRTAHHRYDMGLLGLVTGDGALAAAQADTILSESPAHLLGLALAARAADARGDATARTAFEQRLIAAEAGELRRGLPEYADHAEDIRLAVAAARGSPGRDRGSGSRD